MIRQTIYLPKIGGWLVKVFYAVTTYHIDEILGELSSIGCPDDLIEKAYDNMSRGDCNIGLTYTNKTRRESVVVIGLTSSPEEFENTLSHERGHLIAHIADAQGLDPFGEEVQYLNGKVSMEMFKAAKFFLCEHCRPKLFRIARRELLS